MTTTPLSVSTVRQADGTTVVTAAGEIDMSNTAVLAEALAAATGPVLLDFTAVEYLDSAGLAVLFASADRIALRANPLLGPVLRVSGLADIVDVRESD